MLDGETVCYLLTSIMANLCNIEWSRIHWSWQHGSAHGSQSDKKELESDGLWHQQRCSRCGCWRR